MNMRLAMALMAAGLSLAACTTATNVSSLGPGDRLLPRVAAVEERLPPEAYLDGTGPVSPVQLAARPASGQPQAVRSAAVRPAKPGTDGISSAAKTEPTAFTPEWWEKENREDQRLKNKMRICQGC
jgi:hypothetical protein